MVGSRIAVKYVRKNDMIRLALALIYLANRLKN